MLCCYYLCCYAGFFCFGPEAVPRKRPAARKLSESGERGPKGQESNRAYVNEPRLSIALLLLSICLLTASQLPVLLLAARCSLLVC